MKKKDRIFFKSYVFFKLPKCTFILMTSFIFLFLKRFVEGVMEKHHLTNKKKIMCPVSYQIEERTRDMCEKCSIRENIQ